MTALDIIGIIFDVLIVIYELRRPIKLGPGSRSSELPRMMSISFVNHHPTCIKLDLVRNSTGRRCRFHQAYVVYRNIYLLTKLWKYDRPVAPPTLQHPEPMNPTTYVQSASTTQTPATPQIPLFQFSQYHGNHNK